MTLPGFKYIRSRIIPEETQRGGLGVFIKNNLWSQVHNLKTERDQVWFSLKMLPGTIVGCVYIPPRDSPYYSPASFAHIQEQYLNHDKTVLIGDLNARMADLKKFGDEDNSVINTENPDQVLNTNGRELTSICMAEELAPVNHMKTKDLTCDGGFTLKKRHNGYLNWIG